MRGRALALLLGLLATATAVTADVYRDNAKHMADALNDAWSKGRRPTVAAAATAAGVSVVVKPAWFPTQTCNDFEGDYGRNCLQCNGIDTACNLCLAGNYLSGKVCRKCADPMCLHCGPLDKPCNRCLGVVKSDPYSYSNPGFPTYKDRLGKCRKCTAQQANTGCLQCDVTGKKCTLCDEGYFRMPDGTCKACLDSNCKRCGADLKCLECNQLPHIEYDDWGNPIGGGYGLDPVTKACRRCASPGCLRCKKNYAQCDAGGCQNGLPGAGERGWGRNTAAKRPADQCLPCQDENCSLCQANYRTCTQCMTDTDPMPYLANGKCLMCNLPGCTECQVLPGGFVCKTCRDGYAPVNVNKWGLFTACSPLIPCKDVNCEDCRGNANTCRAAGCKPLYYNVQGRCNQCLVMMCDTCGPANKCRTCMNGYFADSAGICRECLSNRANNNADYSFCDVCTGSQGQTCTKCWPPEEFKPDPRNPSRCVRYARNTDYGIVPV